MKKIGSAFGLIALLLVGQAQAQGQSITIPPGVQSTGSIAANDCAKFTNPLLITSTGAACATATAPGGSTTQLQYNNASAFGGISGWTTNGTTALTGGASTTIAIGGATIGSNALAVTGNGNFSGTIVVGTAKLQDYGSGQIGIGASNATLIYVSSGSLNIGSSALRWQSSADAVSGTTDLVLARDAANTLAQRNGVNAQRGKIFNTWTDASNGEWFDIDWITNANVATIGTNKNGTGSTRALKFIAGGTSWLDVSTAGLPTFATNVVIGDNSGSVGQLTIGVGAGAGLKFGNRGGLFGSGDGIITALDAGGTLFNRFQLGGTTTSYPAIGRSTTDLVAELADGTAGGTMIMSGSAMVGSLTKLTLTQGAIGMSKITASASAPGAAGSKFEVVCGTNAGTAKMVMYAGTSGTAVTVIDNAGTGVTGC